MKLTSPPTLSVVRGNAPRQSRSHSPTSTAHETPTQDRGVLACSMPGAYSIAIVTVASDGSCPIHCILDERWFSPEEISAKIAECETWLDQRDPIAQPSAPLRLARQEPPPTR